MPTKQIALRIDDELLAYLEARANKEHRTLSNMIISILMDEMERNTKLRNYQYRACQNDCDGMG